MKKVLIPTDFTVASLQLIEYAILNYPNTKLDIVLVHGFKMPETRWGLINFSYTRQLNQLMNEEFIKAKNEVCREHSDTVNSISIELFTGTNKFAFKNFCADHEIEDAVIPKEKVAGFKDRKSFDPTSYIRKCVSKVAEIPMDETDERVYNPRFSLSNLLNL